MFVGGSARWYHTLVVVGASLSGCAAKVERSSVPNDANAGSAGSVGGATGDAATGAATGYSVTNPKQCTFDGAFTCADYESLTDCHCEANAPRAPLDCSSPFAYSCRALNVIDSLPDAGLGLTTTHTVGCHCQPNYLTPSDCELPTQFICESVEYGYSGCRCDPNLPQSAAECRPGEWLSCQSDSPRFGCHCECCTIK
ncbi:MAG TPA: hypothetical protein VER96_27070 [Polyangiaceae bacterium]|nr:hypothetical protein [Polyangiaceae bacterium]